LQELSFTTRREREISVAVSAEEPPPRVPPLAHHEEGTLTRPKGIHERRTHDSFVVKKVGTASQKERKPAMLLFRGFVYVRRNVY